MHGSDRKITLQLYYVLGAGLFFSLIPNPIAGGISALLFLAGLIAAYAVRAKHGDEPLVHNHSTYLIRTLWISGLVVLFAVAAGSAFLLASIDNAPLEACIQSLGGNIANVNQADLMYALKPCIDQYIEVNMPALIISASITAIPVLGYFVIRLVRGFKCARAGYEVENLERWF